MILSANEIFKSYGDFGVLAGVSFQIHEGEFVSIIGPNGAGKTTLINVLTGLLKPNNGKVFFKDHDITGIGPAKLSRLGMARSFQLVNIFPTFTVMEFIKLGVLSRQGKGARFYAILKRDREVNEEAEEVAQIFHLEDKRDVQAKNLPQGDKKLLDVASAFALRPEVILLDEPTSGVSTSEKNKIMEILIDASKKMGIKSIIQVEHDMDLVFGFSDRIIALHSGKVLADCTPAEMEKNEAAMCAVVGEKGCFKICSSLLE
ncbi:MAG: ABC transporter ATP-binding protein [Deltaproteobacteria bacterium]|nr:ABC transporter ATP-binding protein [Deltaproteobacteria bacterium]